MRPWQGHCVCGLRVAGQLSWSVRDGSVSLCRCLAPEARTPGREPVFPAEEPPCGGWRSCHLILSPPLASQVAPGPSRQLLWMPEPRGALSPVCIGSWHPGGHRTLSLLQATLGKITRGTSPSDENYGTGRMRGQFCRGRSSGAWTWVYFSRCRRRREPGLGCRRDGVRREPSPGCRGAFRPHGGREPARPLVSSYKGASPFRGSPFMPDHPQRPASQHHPTG